MKRLAAQDAAFLYLETPETPMHVGSLTIFEPGDLSSAEIYQAFRDHTAAQLDKLPYYRRSLQAMPLGIDHPVWSDQDKVDLNYHIRRRILDHPGGTVQLCATVAELHAEPLNRHFPLWQCYVIEGLADGGFAIYMKLHHAEMDGVAAMMTLPYTFEFLPTLLPAASAPTARNRHEKAPGSLQLLSVALADFVQQDIRLVRSAPNLVSTIVKVGRRAAASARLLPRTMKAPPHTPFNTTISKDRIFATLSLPLGQVKSLGKSRNATINDVVMAVCAGGLRRYLSARKALPERPLVAAVPVSLRGPGQIEMNNQTGLILVDLATDRVDPIERLAAIAASARDSRARFLDIKDVFPTELSVPGAPAVLAGIARLAASKAALNLLPPAMNVLISNVPGPRQPMYCAQSRALHHFPVSIPYHNCALNITVLSYVDHIEFGLIAGREAVPDLPLLPGYIDAEFESLKERAEAIAGAGQVETLELRAALLQTAQGR